MKGNIDEMADQHTNTSILSEQILEDQKKNRIDHMTYLPDMEQIDPTIMNKVTAAMAAYDYDSYTGDDVRRALRHEGHISPDDFAALLSPAAKPFLEDIAQAAMRETRKHFGNAILMFTPIYIANYCENYCIYCNFNCHSKTKRAMLDASGIDREMAAIAVSIVIMTFIMLFIMSRTSVMLVTV